MQNHTGQLSAELDGLGLRQTVLTAYRPRAPRREPLGRHGEVLRVGVPTRRLRQGYGLAAARAVAALPGPYDLVHAHLGEDAAVLLVALAAARRWDAPLVVTVHLSPKHTLAGAGIRERFLRTVGGAAETAALRRAAAVITLTERLAEVVRREVAPRRVHVVPSGTRVFDAAPTARPGVLFVGRLHRQKGLDTLVRALPLLPDPVRVTLAGDGPERAALTRLAAELGVADRLAVTGFLPHRAIPGLLAGADVAVLPSRYEELGTVLVEAMAAGRPVVAAAVGGIPELVRDGVDGLLVPPGDPVALAGAIDRLIADPALAARLGASGRARVAGHDWSLLAGRILGIYRDSRPVAAG
jgi:glycosyltransferase involved in cell wall biosynthesis